MTSKLTPKIRRLPPHLYVAEPLKMRYRFRGRVRRLWYWVLQRIGVEVPSQVETTQELLKHRKDQCPRCQMERRQSDRKKRSSVI